MATQLPTAVKYIFNLIADEMSDRYIVVWDSPEGITDHEGYPYSSSLATMIGKIIRGGHIDSQLVQLVQKGSLQENCYTYIAKKAIKKDIPFAVEGGVMTTELRLGDRPLTLSNLLRTIPAHILRKLATCVGVEWNCQEDLVLDSSIHNNGLKHLKRAEWNLQDDSPSAAGNCGPFFVFDKEKALPFIIFYTLKDVTEGEELLTMSNLPLQIE